MLRLSIIGCGQMGAWFASHLAERGADLTLFDKERERAETVAGKVGGRVVESLLDVPRERPILLALPIQATGEVLRQLRHAAKNRLEIVEIAALKGPFWRQINYARRAGHVVASIHPLFGPGQRDDAGTVTIHVESVDVAEGALIRMLLPATKIVNMKRRQHDEAMLTALSLTHFIGSSAALLLSKHKPPGVETKSLSALLSLIAVSLSESDSFYSDYIMNSPHAMKLFKRYAYAVNQTLRVIRDGRIVSELVKIRRSLKEKYDLAEAYQRLYSRASDC